MWTEPDDDALRDLLRNTHTLAVIGVSPDPLRPSNGVYHYLSSASGYELYPVKPRLGELDGRPAYPDLAALPVVPDMVDVFRRQDQLRSVLDQAIAVGAKSILSQQALWDERLAAVAETAGMRVVMDRPPQAGGAPSLKVEHARLLSVTECPDSGSASG